MILPMDKCTAFQTIAEQVAGGELAFPTSARVAMQVRRALDDPDCQIEAAAKLIQAEPLLAARVVAMANSVAYNRSGRDITDIRAAVMRLGFRSVRALATALVTRQLAGNQNPHPELAAQLWEHTAHVAALAHVLARRFTRVDPETALFAGIVHEVGGFYLLSRSRDFPGLVDDDFNDWIETGEAQIGEAVLKVLAVPESVVDAIRVYWEGYLAIPPATLGDTLLLAEELAPVASPMHKLGGAEPGEGMSAKFDLILDQATLSDILRESAEEVASLTSALQF
jgi:HD-like signal output (HDOD) protein